MTMKAKYLLVETDEGYRIYVLNPSSEYQKRYPMDMDTEKLLEEATKAPYIKYEMGKNDKGSCLQALADKFIGVGKAIKKGFKI